MAKDGLTTIKMIQVSKHIWKLVSPKEHVLMEGITVSSPAMAKEFALDYVSSFRNWIIELVPIEEE